MGFKENLQAQRNTLKKENMLVDIVKEIQKEGIVGEEDTILALLLKFTMRLVINSEPTSSNVVVSDESGGGKDNLIKGIGNAVVKKGFYLHRNGLSSKVFTYWHANEENWTWKDKILHMEDPEEELINCQGFKTMASGNPNKVVVKDQKAEEYRSNGKPVLIITSRESQIAMEGVRRWDAVQVDTSNELSEAIARYIANKEMGLIDETPNKVLRDALCSLPPRNVVIPFANELVKYLTFTVQIRTQFHKFLDYIKASAVLHQYQRDKDDKHCIIANVDDLIYASFAYGKFGNEYGVPLNKDERDFMDILIAEKRPQRVSDILRRFNRSKDWIYRHIDKLKSVNLIWESEEFDEQTHRNVLLLSANTELYVVSDGCRVSNPYMTLVNLKRHELLGEKHEIPKNALRNDITPRKTSKSGSFLTFLESVRILDIHRAENKLSPKFENLTNIREMREMTTTTNNLLPTTKEKKEPKSFRKNTRETMRNDEKRPDLNEKAMDLRDFVNNTKSLGGKVTRELLYKNFTKAFIDINIEQNILVKGSDGYDIKG